MASKNELIGVDEKKRKIYQGSRGGYYYIKANGNKSYVKIDKINIQQIKKEKKSEIGVGENGRKIYQGSKGGYYYITDNGKKSYVKIDKINIKQIKKEKQKFGEILTNKKKYDDDEKYVDNIGAKPLSEAYYIDKNGKKKRIKYNKRKYEQLKKVSHAIDKKKQPYPVPQDQWKKWMKEYPEWFDGHEVAVKTVIIKGVRTGKKIKQGEETPDNDAANSKRWPIAIMATLQRAKGKPKTIAKVTVGNPLPSSKIRSYGDAGHLHAKSLGGDCDPSNIVPQNPTINESLGYLWRAFEDRVKKFIEGANSTFNKEYFYTVIPIYGDVTTLGML